MVWSTEREAELPPLSVILPWLYLGAESDVTQDRLASLGISYVLSVSRCSPQPSFLPRSRYLRIPIDDSLGEDLLSWIPQALHFIDAAMSSGASVLVHCAAGISRSPALAVAYIMYSLGMDLDQAYRFVKERRPSISPNFNFLGQLQFFQGTLTQKAPSSDLHIQQLDNHLPSSNDSVNYTYTSPQMNDQVVNSVLAEQTHKVNFNCTDKMQQRHLNLNGIGDQQPCLSGKCRTLHLTLSQYQQHVQTPCDVFTPNPCTSVKLATKPTQLQVPSGPVSLLEKRKSLTLSLTPLGMNPSSPPSNRSQQVADKNVHNIETGGRPGVQRDTSCYRQKGADLHREQTPTHSKCSRAQVKEQGPVSPFTFTLNKLLDWGERLLFRGIFVHPVRMGQPALPYKC